MRFIDCDYQTFRNRSGDKTIILFGASSNWDYYGKIFPDIGRVAGQVSFIVDNDPGKQGQTVQTAGRDIPVRSPAALEILRGEGGKNTIILIPLRLRYHESICRQLMDAGLPEDMECYSVLLMTTAENHIDNSPAERYFASCRTQWIPKRIHSCWFSGEEKPDAYKRCVESWYRYCPDYEILEWNCGNYDVTKNSYMRQAYEKRKWAFVSDYARLDLVYTFGGIYLDMDVELLNTLDMLIGAAAFFCKDPMGIIDLGSGFGSVSGLPLLAEMMEVYEGRDFIKADGEMDTTAQPVLMQQVLARYGWKDRRDSQAEKEVLFLSNDYLTVVDGDRDAREWKGTELGIHWHNGGWLEREDKEYYRFENEARKKLREKYFTDRV